MSDIQNVQLGFSCPIKREEMTKTAKGHFCSGCSKEVIDFTDKSQEDFKEMIKSSKGKICGSFKSSQLSQSFLKYAAATAIASSTLLGACQEKEISPEKQVDIELEEVIEGFVITGDIIEPDGDLQNVHVDPMVYAKPVGGIEKFYETLKRELKFPQDLLKTGRVYVRLFIDDTGKMTKVEVIKGLDPIADQEAVRALKAINYPFKPALYNDLPESSELIFPVYFQD